MRPRALLYDIKKVSESDLLWQLTCLKLFIIIIKKKFYDNNIDKLSYFDNYAGIKSKRTYNDFNSFTR